MKLSPQTIILEGENGKTREIRAVPIGSDDKPSVKTIKVTAGKQIGSNQSTLVGLDFPTPQKLEKTPE